MWRRSAAARLLRLSVRVPSGAWMFVFCECCVLSGRRLCDELITHPEESNRLWCVAVCDLEASRTRWPWPALGHSAMGKNFIHLTTIIYASKGVYLHILQLLIIPLWFANAAWLWLCYKPEICTWFIWIIYRCVGRLYIGILLKMRY